VWISFFTSVFFSIASGIIVNASATAYFSILVLYLLESIVIYDNENTLYHLYLSYMKQEENLLQKFKADNENELLLIKEEELRYLFGNVAHDLKSPLQAFSFELNSLEKRLNTNTITITLKTETKYLVSR